MKPLNCIFRKEMREMFRDRRVITGAFLGPIILIIIMMVLFGFLQKTITSKQAVVLHVVKATPEPSIVAQLRKNGAADVVFVSTLEEGKSLVERGKARILLDFGQDFDRKVADQGAKVHAYYDESEPKSSLGLRTFTKLVEAVNAGLVKGLLVRQGLAESLAEPISIEEHNTSRQSGMGGATIAQMLPYLIVIWAFYGGMSIVSDLVAGEKERGTLETLLIAPVSRRDIALGKFLALSVVCFVSSAMSLLGVVVVALVKTPMTDQLFPGGLGFGFAQMVAVTTVLAPLVALFAAGLLAVSAYAKNMREAQTYLTSLGFVVLMPAIFSQFIGFTDLSKALWVRATPVLNASVAIREALVGKIDAVGLLMTIGSTALLAGAMLWITVRLFSREQVLARI